jgi:hypothetical protein
LAIAGLGFFFVTITDACAAATWGLLCTVACGPGGACLAVFLAAAAAFALLLTRAWRTLPAGLVRTGDLASDFTGDAVRVESASGLGAIFS